MSKRLIAILIAVAAPAAAETVTCPDLSAAAQVGACPTPAELKWGFTGYCSDNARMYDKEDTCSSLETYKALKDVALWEAGEFQGYFNCAQPAEAVKAAKPVGVTVAKAGAITKVVCAYEGNRRMTLRTRKACRVAGDKVECE